jgi:O-methyltransferase
MNPFVKNTLKRIINRTGHRLARTRTDGLPLDFSDDDACLVETVSPYTMTSPEAIRHLRDCVHYVSARGIPGAFVECGVWKGGSSMVAAITFKELGDHRDVYLIDAFDLPIPPPMDLDTEHGGNRVFGGATETKPYWAAVTAKAVAGHMKLTAYPENHVHIVKGLIADVVPYRTPDSISVLRLDTDTYESTIHNLRHLYPRLSDGGILILDDYGSHAGIRQAVSEYFNDPTTAPLIQRVDASAGCIQKFKLVPSDLRDARC